MRDNTIPKSVEVGSIDDFLDKLATLKRERSFIAKMDERIEKVRMQLEMMRETREDSINNVRVLMKSLAEQSGK